MKIMRVNYDKPHRCPTWSGPGWSGGKGECAGGSFARVFHEEEYHQRKRPEWRFHTCESCGVVVLPEVLKNLDPTWWTHRIRVRVRNIQYRWADWKYWRELDKQEKNN